MKKLNLLLLLILLATKGTAQVDETLLFSLTPLTSAEIATITSPTEGTLIYNEDEQKMFVSTPAGFTKIPSLDPNSIDFWSAIGTSGSNPAVHFLGTLDAQDMVLRANNEERLLLSGSNQTVRINGATQFNNHPFVIRANVDDVMAFQTSTGVTEWHWNLVGNGLNFVETGVADFRIFMEQGGNVGIDTGTPSEKLDVNGALRVRTTNTTTSDLDVLVTTATGVVEKRTFTNLSDAIVIPKLNFGGRWTNTDTTTNLNINSLDVPIFGAEDYKDDGIDLYEVNGTNDGLTVKESGRYDIRANLSLQGIDDVAGNTEQRTNVNARITVNGTPVGAFAASGYIRYSGNTFNNNTSIHINEILELNANDVLTIETIANGNTGIVNFSGANESSFMINKLK